MIGILEEPLQLVGELCVGLNIIGEISGDLALEGILTINHIPYYETANDHGTTVYIG